MATKTIKIDEAFHGLVAAYAKETGFTEQEAAEKLINTGYSRLTALQVYAAKKAVEKPAKPKKKAAEKKTSKGRKKKAAEKKPSKGGGRKKKAEKKPAAKKEKKEKKPAAKKETPPVEQATAE